MTELLILTTLFLKPCHGYEIRKMFPGMKINNNTLYPMLKKMVTSGYVRMEIQSQENKPAKKVYELTEAGKERLFELVSDFNDENVACADEFYLRVAFCQFLPKQEIERILESRIKYLNTLYNHQKLMKILELFPDDNSDILNLKHYSETKVYNEIQFVKDLKRKYDIE